MPRLIDLTGQSFGRWTVIKRAPNRNNRTFWECQCECGNIKEVPSVALRNGESKSCGCLNNELCAKLGSSKKKDLIGQQFGRLTVINYAISDSRGQARWICECSCGNIVEVRGSSLISGNTKSCGKCSHISYGEQKIIDLLQSNSIDFEYQKIFDNCRFPNTNKVARFDFYVDNRYLIEYDGEQHFHNKEQIFRESLKVIQERDNFKNQWCKDNDIPLIRIPYTKLDKLSFQDIWLPTT